MVRPVLSQAKSNSAILVTCVGTAVAAVCSSGESSQSHAEKKQKNNDRHQYLEMYLMDRISKKPYLNYHSAPSSVHQRQTTRHYRGEPNEKHPTSTDDIPVANSNRQKGVPSRLRLLTIDVPQFKEDAFEHGICKLPSEIFDTDEPSFVDGVAPPKPMNKTLGNNKRAGTRSSRKPIVQKSLAKQLYYCYDPNPPCEDLDANDESTSESPKEQNQPPSVPEQNQPQPVIGVEILESSLMNMNPNNIRRTYTSVSNDNWRKRTYKYDPGKYTRDDADDQESDIADDSEDYSEDDSEEGEAIEQKTSADESRLNTPAFDSDSEEIDIDNPDYERTSPWNQYAWLEEIHLRINGIVPFGAPMQRAPFLSQWMYGRIYRQSIPASSSRGGWVSWLWWPVLWSGSHAIGSERYRLSWDGVDGEGENVLYGSNPVNGKTRYFLPWTSPSKAVLNRASNKPHAVICDGSAMQRVPGSLRYLSKICREAQIPLYILNDPRSWGSQTHSTLSDALVDMRKTVSDNVIQNALALREGSAFERGRFVGQLEKEMAWQAYDAARKTREALMDARQRLRMDRVEDWSGLDESQLLKKLIERQVVTLQDTEEGVLEDAGAESKGNSNGSMKYSEAFDKICRHCTGTQSDHRQEPDEPI